MLLKWPPNYLNSELVLPTLKKETVFKVNTLILMYFILPLEPKLYSVVMIPSNYIKTPDFNPKLYLKPLLLKK